MPSRSIYGIHFQLQSGNYQWDSPNLWPCLQWIAYKALKNYGYNGDALRIAQKYVSVVEINEAKTGQLWEKYNADSGFCDVINEYPMPPMLGWSAGVYLKFKGLRELSERREKIHGSVLTLPQTVESDQLYR